MRQYVLKNFGLVFQQFLDGVEKGNEAETRILLNLEKSERTVLQTTNNQFHEMKATLTELETRTDGLLSKMEF